MAPEDEPTATATPEGSTLDGAPEDKPDVYDELALEAEQKEFQASPYFYKGSLIEQVTGDAKEWAPNRILERRQYKTSEANLAELETAVQTASEEIIAALQTSGQTEVGLILREQTEKTSHADYTTDKKQNVGATVSLTPEGSLFVSLQTGLEFGSYDAQYRMEQLGQIDPQKPGEVLRAEAPDDLTDEQRKGNVSLPKDAFMSNNSTETDPLYPVVAEVILQAQAVVSAAKLKQQNEGGDLDLWKGKPRRGL